MNAFPTNEKVWPRAQTEEDRVHSLHYKLFINRLGRRGDMQAVNWLTASWIPFSEPVRSAAKMLAIDGQRKERNANRKNDFLP